MKANLPPAGPSGEAYLATTRWSVILSCAGSGKTPDALGELCRVYWRPIFLFICRRGNSTADAQDLTQDFFVQVLEGNLLKLADPARGRFRSLLFKALQHFLIAAHKKQQRLKRGGAIHFVAWHDWMAEAPSQLRVPGRMIENWPAEKLFDYRWAATVAEQALRRLGEECEAAGRRRVFETMSASLTADRADVSYPQLAERLGISPDLVKRLLGRLRQRYRELLRAEVEQTVADPAEVDEELRYLCAALASVE